MGAYEDFVARKLRFESGRGIDEPLRDYGLFPHQQDLTRWALRRGRAAIFAETGLGKSRMQVAWADMVCRETGGSVLILAPLAVAEQTVEEGSKIGVRVTHARDGADIQPGINITNYARLHRFDCSQFAGCVMDESSIIKHHDSKTLQQLKDAFIRTQYKLCATATPAPNDWTELGTHAEFLGYRTQSEMLAEFFVHDGGDTGTWKLKGHARALFWKWVATWGAMIRSPADLGYDASAYELPELTVTQHTVQAESEPLDGMLFALEASTLSERRSARRASLEARALACAELVKSQPDQDWIVWVDLNDEADAMLRAIPGAVEVRGSDEDKTKEDAVAWFVGKKCLCGDAQWKKRLTSKNTTNETAKTGLQNQLHTSESTRTSESVTWPSTTETILKNFQEGHQSSRPNTTEGEEKSTQSAQRPAKSSSPHLEIISQRIQKNDSTKESKSTGSLQTTIGECLQGNLESARYAEAATLETLEATDSMLTTVMRQELSEGCSAPLAILESGNSETLQSCLIERQCTCGHRKGGRVLISKPRMFGYGLNLQNCARMAFVGVTDSFEAYYQAVRRCWRFGQKRPVHVHIFASEQEGAVVSNLARKEADARAMSDALAAETLDAVRESVLGFSRETNNYNAIKPVAVPGFLRSLA